MKNSIDSLVALRFTMNSKGGNHENRKKCMSKENLDEQVQKFGSLEK